MFPKPKSALVPNTYSYESEPMVKATGFREYDARWLLGKEINLMGVQALGMGLGTMIRAMGVKPEIVTGHDFRGSSASVKTSLVHFVADPSGAPHARTGAFATGAWDASNAVTSSVPGRPAASGAPPSEKVATGVEAPFTSNESDGSQ